MNLSNQIKELRARDGLSQEALAERIYVTRQTVSNWETGRSYPDIQSLLLLSALFNVSLDELVKGDIEIMKKELDAHKMKIWSTAMIVFFVAALAIAWPLYSAFDLLGLLPPAALLVFALIAAIVLEMIKAKHNLVAYSEIVDFCEGKNVDEDKMAFGRKHPVRATLLKLALGAVVGFALTAASYFIWMAITG